MSYDDQPIVEVVITVKQHTVDYNRLMDYLRKTYQRNDTIKIKKVPSSNLKRVGGN